MFWAIAYESMPQFSPFAALKITIHCFVNSFSVDGLSLA